MRIRWENPVGRNAPYEVFRGESGDYSFSLCTRQDDDDPFPFRLFVYRTSKLGGGFKHLGGSQTIEEAKRAAEVWLDKEEPCDRS